MSKKDWSDRMKAMSEDITAHHVIEGFIEGSGAGVTATSLEPNTGKRWYCHDMRGDCGHEGPPKLLLGYWIWDTWQASQYRVAGKQRYWCVTKVWNDDTPDRIERRSDKRKGHSRSHSILWPSQAAAFRCGHLVHHIDPVTLDLDLKVAPEPVVIKDSQCQQCSGTGRQAKPDLVAMAQAERDTAIRRADRLEEAMRVIFELHDVHGVGAAELIKRSVRPEAIDPDAILVDGQPIKRLR